MIDININYNIDGINCNLSIAEGERDENLAYNLAKMFNKVILDIGVAPVIVIDEMKGYFDIEEEDEAELQH